MNTGETNLRSQELACITSLQIHPIMLLLKPYVFLLQSVSSSQCNSKEVFPLLSGANLQPS